VPLTPCKGKALAMPLDVVSRALLDHPLRNVLAYLEAKSIEAFDHEQPSTLEILGVEHKR
jgi:hypothetical protein